MHSRRNSPPLSHHLRWTMLARMACIVLPLLWASLATVMGAPPAVRAPEAALPQPTTSYKPALPGSVMGNSPLDNTRPLAVGDKLSFRILEEGGDPYILTVASSGEVEFPFVGRVKVSGRTCKAVADIVKSLLEKSFYKTATVSLALEMSTTLPIGTFYVTGQVVKQGMQEIPREREVTVAGAILEAGGFADFADRRRVRLIRQGPDGKTQKFTIDVKAVLEKGEMQRDMLVRPGDYIVVPERMFNF